MKLRKIIILNVLIIIVGFVVAVAGSIYWKENEVRKGEIKRKEMYDKILDAASISPTKLTVNFTKPISTGSPLIFGGVHNPSLEQQDAWNKLQEVGITMMRKDFAINWMVSNTTVEAYKNNVNNIQDIKNWNRLEMEKIKLKFTEAKKRGMKTIGIVDYTPSWLSYDNTVFGVPMDWEVFEDLVGKMYSFYRSELDYVEIWNEPDHKNFLTLGNSNMSREEAYEKIFYYATKAIREVDQKANDGKIILIGGPVNSVPHDTLLLETILANKKTRDMINFISYHNYGTEEPSWNDFKNLLKQYGMENYPIFITEWNYDWSETTDNPSKTSSPAILYTGNKFVSFLKMGVKGANYYSLLPINKSGNEKPVAYLGFYRWENGQATLLPQARTWRILSKQMGLGKGESKIFDVKQESSTEKPTLVEVVKGLLGSETFNTIGFRNVDGQYGLAIVNDKASAQLAEVNLENTSFKRFVKVQVYYASAGNEAKASVYEGELIAKNGKLNFAFYIPQESVVGMIFTEEKEWYDILHLPAIN